MKTSTQTWRGEPQRSAEYGSSGVRPSPGAASSGGFVVSRLAGAADFSSVAAPGDGRTPLSRSDATALREGIGNGTRSAQLEIAAPAVKSWPAIYADLFKARLTTLVLLTAMVGFYVGFRGPMDYLLMLHTLLGTALVAGGASALNQLLEREYDAKMRRTQSRPLPSGNLQPRTVLWVGSITAALGLVYLARAVNPLTSLLGAFSLLSYLFIYTPLKRRTWLNTAVGAVPGALPPLMGWTAARGELSSEGWALFAILAFWQLPHFLAIAWVYRDEYARAGFKMLPVIDPAGHRTGRQAVWHTLGLLPVSLCPFLFHLAGPLYLAGAFALGLIFLWSAIQFSRQLTVSRARQLFLVSIAYLPLLLGLLVFDKIR